MKKGFTLIELLVVVLIIGILSSVALPQYQKAVLKSRASEAWTNLKNINMAANAYCLETGSTVNFADVREDLAVSVKNSKNFEYSGSLYCSGNAGIPVAVFANWVGGGNYNFKLAVNPNTGRRSCEGASCNQLGFTKTATDNVSICLCGGGAGRSCYYAD